jgi:lipid A ethanolaminephosphotransferase
MTQLRIIILSALFLMLVGNAAMYQAVTKVYPINAENLLFLLSLFVVFWAVNGFILGLICFRRTVKWVLPVIFLCSSQAAYFMDTYNVVIDDSMLENAMATDTAETLDLLSIQQILYFLLLGVLPSWLIIKLPLADVTMRRAVLQRGGLLIGAVVVIALSVVSLSSFYASFLREHKQLRFYANPSYYMYSVGRLVKNKVDVKDRTLKPRGEDAVLIRGEKPRLMVVIVGETLRADHLGLNGYHRQTTPLLAARDDVYSFKDVWACGTSTAFSVPCMFALEGMEDYDRDEARYIENVLDVAKRAGVNVVWLDNNSDSKGVADRVTFLDYKNPANNPVCDDECRDEGMWQGLQEVIAQSNQRDTLIVLHQMGNHGPAYFRRYPERFAHYTPVCETNQLEQCPREHIINAYDNIIHYTDYFIDGVINELDGVSDQFDTSMLYISDHGESLGENNLYLHGLPYAFAPDEQKKVPMLLWVGEGLAHPLKASSLKEELNNPLSHDVISHTILGMLNIKTSVYRSELDILAPLHD